MLFLDTCRRGIACVDTERLGAVTVAAVTVAVPARWRRAREAGFAYMGEDGDLYLRRLCP